MPRLPALLSTGAVVLLAAVVLDARPTVFAQDATPAVEALPEAIVGESLASGEVPALPPLPATISLDRFRFAPGAAGEIPADDPGLALVYVESGTATLVLTAPVLVQRAASLATPGALPFEEVAAGTEFTLEAGDSFVGPPNSGGSVRNDGPGELVSLVAAIVPTTAATPTP